MELYNTHSLQVLHVAIFWNFHYSKKSNSFCEVANWLKLSITHSADLNFWNINFKVMLKYMIWRRLWPLVQPLHIWSAINTKFKELFCFFKPSIEQHFCKQSKACKHSCRSVSGLKLSSGNATTSSENRNVNWVVLTRTQFSMQAGFM